MSYDALFSPIKLRGLELKNRVLLPGMNTKMVKNKDFVSDDLVAYHAARAAGKIRLPLLYSVLEKEFQLVHGRFHAIDDDFPVNGECGKRRPDLFRNGLLNLHLRIDTQMGQCLEGIGAQGVSRVGPAVKKLNPGHGAGYVRNASVWEDSSSNK